MFVNLNKYQSLKVCKITQIHIFKIMLGVQKKSKFLKINNIFKVQENTKTYIQYIHCIEIDSKIFQKLEHYYYLPKVIDFFHSEGTYNKINNYYKMYYLLMCTYSYLIILIIYYIFVKLVVDWENII